MHKQLIAFIFAFLILISALFATHQSQKEQQAQQRTPLADFSLADISGTVHPISTWQGKILIINFWATWCPPCLKEIPEFIELQAHYANQNVQFIGIAIDDPQLVEDYLSFVDINYPILIAESEGEKLAQKLGNVVNAIPFTLIVNQQGQIIFRHPGELSKAELGNIIEPLLKPNSVTSIPGPTNTQKTDR